VSRIHIRKGFQQLVGQDIGIQTTENFTCPSWLSGKLSENIEINTSLPYVSIYDYFAQGEQAAEKWACNML